MLPSPRVRGLHRDAVLFPGRHFVHHLYISGPAIDAKLGHAIVGHVVDGVHHLFWARDVICVGSLRLEEEHTKMCLFMQQLAYLFLNLFIYFPVCLFMQLFVYLCNSLFIYATFCLCMQQFVYLFPSLFFMQPFVYLCNVLLSYATVYLFMQQILKTFKNFRDFFTSIEDTQNQNWGILILNKLSIEKKICPRLSYFCF